METKNTAEIVDGDYEEYAVAADAVRPDSGGLGVNLFLLGNLYITPGAEDALQRTEESELSFLVRHLSGDWGDLCDADKEENELALTKGYRLLSAYHTTAGDKLWVITEADRSSTTILLPSEY
jgi:hypothetical protein